MGQLATAQTTRCQNSSIDLQVSDLQVQASELRASEQRERLNRVAEELVEMLDELESRLRADRSRAVPIIAEYLGPLEAAAEDISSIRDIDERFGGSGDRMPMIARHAEQLEKGLAYLLGVLSVATSSDNMSQFNWRLVERDVQEVQAIADRQQDTKREPPMKVAA